MLTSNISHNDSILHLLIPSDLGVSRNTTFYNAVNASLDFDFNSKLVVGIVATNFKALSSIYETTSCS